MKKQSQQKWPKWRKRSKKVSNNVFEIKIEDLTSNTLIVFQEKINKLDSFTIM